MANFTIFETNRFQKDLTEDFQGQQKKIYTKLTEFVYPQLRENPYLGKNIKKLVNWKPDTWRYRIGNYRFFYIIDEKKKIVFMITAEHRRNVY